MFSVNTFKFAFARLRSAIPLAVLWLVACGGGGATPAATAPAATYSVSATVTGLQAGKSVTIMDDNGGNVKTATANGAITFAPALPAGTGYIVTVGTQPAAQTCNVVHGTGIIGTADVTNVQVNCGALFAYVANTNSNNVSASKIFEAGIPVFSTIPSPVRNMAWSSISKMRVEVMAHIRTARQSDQQGYSSGLFRPFNNCRMLGRVRSLKTHAQIAATL